MIRSSRLMATMLAAVFAAVLATPAYATGTSTCEQPPRARMAPAARRRAPSSTTSTPTASATAGEPGLAGWRIWADYDNDGVRDTGEPYDDTDANGDYKIEGIKPTSTTGKTRTTTTTSGKKYRLREQRPGGGTDGWTCSYPNASTSGGFANGTGGDFGCGHGPIDVSKDPKVTGKDFGNYKKPKITVIKKLVPASDAGRFDLKVDGATIKAAAGDGGSGSVYVTPGAHQVTETGGERHQPRRLHGLDRLQDHHGRAHLRPGLGPRQAG